MVKGGRQKTKIFFIVFGACAVALAVALNIGLVILYWRTGLLLVLGIIFFGVIITGLVLNTTFLVREIRRNEQHDAFINAVTHELKTPVASIRLYLQTLERRDIEEAKRREFYSIMLADTDRLANTIDQVLQAARNHSQKLVNRSPVNLRMVVKECLDLAHKRHNLPPGALQYTDSIAAEPVILGDADELRAAVSNLLDNAVKYSGTEISIALELADLPKNRVAVRVKDRGVGIPPGETKRIFKRFYRVPGTVASRVKGSGLGLFIVRSVAERHGGRAYAESEGSGLGSVFTIELPLTQRS